MILSIEYRQLIFRLSEYFQERGVTVPVQLLKIQEELGEATQAYIGSVGLNPRKGLTHTENDVAMELADVVATCLIAMEMLGCDADAKLQQQALKMEDRQHDAS